MNTRALGFRVMDALRGGPVQAHIRDIEATMSGVDSDLRQRRLLRAQLNYVVSRVPYYRGHVGATDLSEFPITNKSLIRHDSAAFVANGIDPARMHVASTSGSTGTPFKALHDARKRRRVQAEVQYWGRQAGYTVGERLFHLKVWTPRNQMSRVSALLRNVFPVDVTRLTEAEWIQFALRAAQSGSSAIIAYGSALESIAHSLRTDREAEAQVRNGRSLTAIIAQSESLSPGAREYLRDTFGHEPVGRYGLEELGIVAQQPLGSAEYLINTATQWVEILDQASDESAGSGELGRIVVTELWNRAQPMVRYDTGDLGAFALQADGTDDRTKLARVEGRKLDQVYDSEDRALSPMVMYNVWWRYPEIGQYQLVQRGRADYLLRLNVTEGFTRTEALTDDFKAVVGKDALVEIEQTTERFELASGKRQSVVSKYDPSGSHK